MCFFIFSHTFVGWMNIIIIIINKQYVNFFCSHLFQEYLLPVVDESTFFCYLERVIVDHTERERKKKRITTTYSILYTLFGRNEILFYFLLKMILLVVVLVFLLFFQNVSPLPRLSTFVVNEKFVSVINFVPSSSSLLSICVPTGCCCCC